MRARPSVAYRVSVEQDVVFEGFRAALKEPGCPCSGTVGRQEITLHLQDDRRRPWSPWLQLRVESDESGTLLLGKMGPQPNLWTAFVFIYSCLVAAFVAGTMYGFVQSTLGDSPSGLYAAMGALVGLSGACGLDLLGRRLSQGQMGTIRGFVLRTVPGAEELDEEPSQSPIEPAASP